MIFEIVNNEFVQINSAIEHKLTKMNILFLYQRSDRNRPVLKN